VDVEVGTQIVCSVFYSRRRSGVGKLLPAGLERPSKIEVSLAEMFRNWQ